MINSEWFLILQSTSFCNNKKIGGTPYKVFVFALMIASLPQRKMEKIFQNRFWPWNLYKL